MVQKEVVTEWLLLGLLTLVCFGSILLRPDLVGVDSYASVLCSKGDCSYLGLQPFAVGVFSVLPASLLVFKFVMLCCVFCCVGIFYLMLKEKYGFGVAWKGLLLLFALSPLLLFNLGQFENEIFAYPLIFASFYLVFCKKNWLRWLSLPLLAISLFFWGGTVYFIVGLSLYWFVFLAPSVLILYFQWQEFLHMLIPTDVLESMFLSALIGLFGLIFVVPFIFRVKSLRFWLFFLFLLALVGFQGKLVMLLAPFFVIGIGELLVLLNKKNFNINSLLIGFVFLIVCWNVAFFMLQPTQEDWRLVNQSIKLSEDTNYPLLNDWSFGYWLKIKGFDTNSYGNSSTQPDLNNLSKVIVLTQEDLNCRKVSGYVNLGKQMNLYSCD